MNMVCFDWPLVPHHWPSLHYNVKCDKFLGIIIKYEKKTVKVLSWVLSLTHC